MLALTAAGCSFRPNTTPSVRNGYILRGRARRKSHSSGTTSTVSSGQITIFPAFPERQNSSPICWRCHYWLLTYLITLNITMAHSVVIAGVRTVKQIPQSLIDALLPDTWKHREWSSFSKVVQRLFTCQTEFCPNKALNLNCRAMQSSCIIF